MKALRGGVARPLTLSLTALCVVFAFFIALNLTVDFVPAPPHPQASEGPNMSLPAALPENSLRAGPLSSYDEFSNRPLFNSSRRPPAAPDIAGSQDSPSVAEQAQPLDDLALVGVMIAEKNALVLLHSSNESQDIVLSIGDIVRGWHVTQIEPNKVALRVGDSVKELAFPSYDADSPPNISAPVSDLTTNSRNGSRLYRPHR